MPTSQTQTLTDQPTQRDVARERTIANDYENLVLNGIEPDRAADIVANTLSTPSFTMPPAEVKTIAQRVKQRDNA